MVDRVWAGDDEQVPTLGRSLPSFWPTFGVGRVRREKR